MDADDAPLALFDSSALLAFLVGEAGADVVEAGLEGDRCACSAVNWSEVAQKVRAAGRDWSTARTLLLDYDLDVVPVTTADAEVAATMWSSGLGLSIAYRLCLATAERLDAVVWTADSAWAGQRVRQIR